VFAAAGILHAMLMRRVVLSPVAFPAISYSSALSQTARFIRKVIEHKIVLCFSLKPLSETFIALGRIQHVSLHVNYPSFGSDFNENLFFRQIFEKSSNSKFHEDLSSGGRVVPYGRTDKKAYMTKLIVAFREFVNAPKKLK
jgi:hypothetical protein